jgi:hypothetical protein
MNEFSRDERVSFAYSLKVLMNCFRSDDSLVMDGACYNLEVMTLQSKCSKYSACDIDSDCVSNKSEMMNKTK